MILEEREKVLRSAVVRVLGRGGAIVGTGFLVSPEHVLTCAHVIIQALREDADSDLRGREVEISFAVGGRSARAVVVGDHPPDQDAEDVALLQLSEGIPEEVTPVVLGTSSGLEGRPLRGFGFPKVRARDGLWMTATVVGPLDSLKHGRRIQVGSTTISPGCSGSPLWDENGRVVAIVVSIIDQEQVTGRHTDTALAIATETVVRVYSALSVHEVQQNRRSIGRRSSEDLTVPKPQHATTSFRDAADALDDGTGRIKAFLEFYLGTNAAPIAFGGRAVELERLSQWLDDSNGPSHMLLTGTAGSGKSALLAQWVIALKERTDLSIVFVPVSIRFRTNLITDTLAMLGSRLAQFSERDAPPSTLANVNEWRRFVRDSLRHITTGERLVLIVIDGVDEYVDWNPGPDLVPADSYPNLRVVVSARPMLSHSSTADWLGALGWDRPSDAVTMELAGLSSTALADILTRSGVSATDALVYQLYQLTEGDPLLVQMYLRELRTFRGRSGSDLTAYLEGVAKPGLGGYFEWWMKDQEFLWRQQNHDPLRENAVTALLSCLACALGPLRRQDLAFLTRSEVKDAAWRLDTYLRPMERFLLEDPVRGIVFQHARLAEHFRGRLERTGEFMTWDGRFLTWGLEVLEGLHAERLMPADTPPYLVRHLGVHLVRAGADVDAQLKLASGMWYQVWETHEGSPTGFLNDVHRVWEYLVAVDSRAVGKGLRPPHTVDELLCVLCASSINSLTVQVPSELLTTAVRAGLWTTERALAYVSTVRAADEKGALLESLVSQMSENDVARAMDIARTLPRRHGICLRATLANKLAEYERRSIHGELLGEVQTLNETVQVTLLLPMLPLLGAEEKQIADDMFSNALKSWEGPFVIAQSTWGKAADWTQLSNESRHLAVSKLFELIQLARLSPEGKSVFGLVGEAVGFDGDFPERAVADLWETTVLEFLGDIVPHLSASDASVAMSLARSVPAEHRAACVALAAHLLPDQERAAVYDEVFAELALTEKAWRRAEIIEAIAPLSATVRADEILNAVLAIDSYPYFRRRAFLCFARHAPVEMVLRALPLIESEIEQDDFHQEVLLEILPRAELALREEVYQRVFALTFKLGSKGKWDAIKTLAKNLPEGQNVKTLVDLCVMREGEWSIVDSLLDLAHIAPSAEQGEIVQRAILIFDEMGRGSDWTKVFFRLADQLPVTRQQDIIRRMLDEKFTIGDKESHAETIAMLAKFAPEGARADLLRKAMRGGRFASVLHIATELAPAELIPSLLVAIEGLSDRVGQSEALIALAPRLSQDHASYVTLILQGMGDTREAGNALLATLPYFPPDKVGAVAELAIGIGIGRGGASALSALIQRLPEHQRGNFIESLLDDLDPSFELSRKYRRATAPRYQRWFFDLVHKLTQLGGVRNTKQPHAPSDEVNEEATVTSSSWLDDWRARLQVLVALLRHVPKELFADIALDLNSTVERGMKSHAFLEFPLILAEALPEFPDAWRDELLDHLHVLDVEVARLLIGLLGMLVGSQMEVKGFDVKKVLDLKEEDLKDFSDNIGEFTAPLLLLAFAPFLPPGSLHAAHDIAWSFKTRILRRAAVRQLVSRFPAELAGNAFERAFRLDAGLDRERALMDLCPHVPESVMPQMIATLSLIEAPIQRARALMLFIPRLEEPARVPYIRELMALWRDLPASVQLNFGDVASKLEGADFFDRANMFGPEGLPLLIDGVASFAFDWVDAFLDCIASGRVSNVYSRRDSPKVQGLAFLARYTPAGQVLDVLELILERSSSDEYAAALAGILPRLPELSLAQQYRIWNALMSRMICQRRADALATLRTIAPALKSLAGDESVSAVAGVVLNVGRWWP